MSSTSLSPGRGAIGYVRVSTDDQVRGYSLDHQRGVITTWCQRQGIPLVGIEVAEDSQGESGKDLDRPALQRVLARVVAGGIGWVVVAKVDRLSRSLEDTCVLVESWDDAGVVLVAPEDGLDGQRGGSRTFLYLRSWMAEEERRRIVGRVGPGLLARARAGLPLGRIPFGYRMVQEGVAGSGSRRSQRLAPDPVTGPLVTMLFERAAQSDWGARRLAAWATQHFPGRRFSYGQVAGLLRNPIYLGTLAVRVGTEQVLRLKNHEPLVGEELFHAVQAKRRVLAEEHAARERHVRASSWLGGMALCGRCGSLVSLWTDDAGTGHYQCQTRSLGVGCGAPRWPQDETDTHVLDGLYAKLTDDLGAVARLVDQAIDKIPAFLDVRRAQAALLLERTERDERDLLSSLEQGILPANAFASRATEIRRERETAQVLLAETDGYTFLADLWRRRGRESTRMHPAVARLLTDSTHERFPASREQTVRVWIPLPLIVAEMSLPERRRLLRAAMTSVTLAVDGSLPHVVLANGPAAYARLGRALGGFLAQGQGIRVPA